MSRSIVLALLCSLCGVSWIARDVRAADVRGQLLLGSAREPTAAKLPRPAFNWELENGVKEVVATHVVAQRELAVVLLGAGSPKNKEPVDVSVSGGALLPSTLVLRADTTLRIRNDDEIGHELYAVGLDGFSAEATSPNGSRSVHLTKVGSWPVLDRLASHAHAHLHVIDNVVATAKLEPNGSFAFADVPAGKYTLKVFRGPSELASKEVDVGDKPLTVDALTLGQDKSGS